jgi:hypothetical protein
MQINKIPFYFVGSTKEVDKSERLQTSVLLWHAPKYSKMFALARTYQLYQISFDFVELLLN